MYELTCELCARTEFSARLGLHTDLIRSDGGGDQLGACAPVLEKTTV
jgi:hypothetical protein